MPKDDYHRKLADDLVSNLEALGSGGSGAMPKRGENRAVLAQLRRYAGRRLGDSPAVYRLFYQLLPQHAIGKPWLEEACFLVATLYPLARGGGASIAGALRQYVAQDEQRTDAANRRLEALLDASADELAFRLRQVVRLLDGQGIGIDWRQTLVDVLRWDWAGHPVQKQWARDYFGTLPASPAAADDVTEEAGNE